ARLVLVGKLDQLHRGGRAAGAFAGAGQAVDVAGERAGRVVPGGRLEIGRDRLGQEGLHRRVEAFPLVEVDRGDDRVPAAERQVDEVGGGFVPARGIARARAGNGAVDDAALQRARHLGEGERDAL